MNPPFRHALAAGALQCAMLAAASVYAHGGEDHGDAAPALSEAASSRLPRTSATTEDFEIVAV
ncbi:MAG: hypothetical protein ABI696_12380, partial [Rubrivivax sp.]